MSQHPAIAIIGGGLGGLTLARILFLHGIEASVFERELDPLARPQGGSLDMHADTGQYALRLADLECDFQSLARYNDQANKLYRHDGTLVFEDAGTDGDRPEIDRSQLRQLLLKSLPGSAVRWGRKVESVRPLPDDRYEVVANGGQGEMFDVVVGADGGWSAVRQLVSSAVPFYEGVTIVELGIDSADERYPAIATLVGHGKMFAKAPSKTLAAQRNANGHLRVYAALRFPESEVERKLSTPKHVRDELATRFAGFAPELLELIAVGDLLAVRPLYALPIGHRWNTRRGVTLIGDAAHLMSPFGGEGANGAMADGADLAMALARSSDWHQAIADYEAIMFPRAEEAAISAAEGLRWGVLESSTPMSEYLQLMHCRGDDEGRERQCVSTPKYMFETRFAEMTLNAEARRKINGAYRFDLSGPDGGTWIVDFNAASAGVRQSDEVGECVVTMTDKNFVAMVAGDISPRAAFISGKLKIKGSMVLALKLAQALEE